MVWDQQEYRSECLPEFSSRITTAPDVMFRIIGDEAVILNLKSELYLGLNPVGTRFWTALHEAPPSRRHTNRCSASSTSHPSGSAMTWTNFSVSCLIKNSSR